MQCSNYNINLATALAVTEDNDTYIDKKVSRLAKRCWISVVSDVNIHFESSWIKNWFHGSHFTTQSWSCSLSVCLLTTWTTLLNYILHVLLGVLGNVAISHCKSLRVAIANNYYHWLTKSSMHNYGLNCRAGQYIVQYIVVYRLLPVSCVSMFNV